MSAAGTTNHTAEGNAMPGTDVARREDAAQQKAPVALRGPQADFDTAYRLAKNLSVSQLLPKPLQGKAADVLTTILYGQELGLAPMQAIQSIYVVNGRPTISGQLWVALARKHGHKVRVTEETPTSCTVSVIRRDDPGHEVQGTFTLDDAKRANLATKDIWKAHPAAMLYARAVSIACRRACPEIALGFYGEHEITVEAEPHAPGLAQAVAQREDRPGEQYDDDSARAEVTAMAAEYTQQPSDDEAMVADQIAFEAELAESENQA